MEQQVLWEGYADKHYHCTVERVDELNGRLTVVDQRSGHTLLDREVPLSFGAIFGPDGDDILTWEAWSLEAIDNREKGDEPPVQAG